MTHPCTCTHPPGQRRRCGQNILDGRLVAFVETEGQTERLDLCRDCAGLFSQWFLRRPAGVAPLRSRVREARVASTAFDALFSG